MAYVQSSQFSPAGFTMMNVNCRQAAQNQDIQMVASVNNVGLWNGQAMPIDGGVPAGNRWPQQLNGPQISDLHRATAFTNGRKRSRENIECEEMKKPRTDGNNAMGYEHVFMNQMQPAGNPYGQPIFQAHLGVAHNNPASCFPSSFVEHQSLMYAERHYDGSILAALVAEAHGC